MRKRFWTDEEKRRRRFDKGFRSYLHWRWLAYVPQHRYIRAMRLWQHLTGGKRPRGMVYDGNGGRLHFDSGTFVHGV